MSEQQADYVTEAMELLNGEPAAIIEQPRARLVLREGIGEEWTVAWVKMSTAFKPHIKEIRGAPLAVWLYIALSVNEKGVSFPSINKIATDTGYSRNGVMDAVKILEEKGYLKVRRGERRWNIYEPEFAAIGRMNEPSDESTQFTGPVSEADRSTFSPNESSGVDLNKRNKTKQDMPVSWKIQHGEKVTQEEIDAENGKDLALQSFERTFGFGVLPWNSNTVWSKFARFVIAQYPNNWFGDYVEWREGTGKYKAFSNKKIRENPAAFIDTGYPEYEASKRYRAPQDKSHAL